MIHREFIRLFYEHMEIDSAGQYIINWRGNRCYIEVEDTPFVVRRTVPEESDQADNLRLILYLSDDTREELAPDTLYVGDGNVLYCKVKNNTFPARFNRAAYYQLAEHIEEENGKYIIILNGKKYPL